MVVFGSILAQNLLCSGEILDFISGKFELKDGYQVYIIWIKENRFPLYVGTSSNTADRLKQHFGLDGKRQKRSVSPIREIIEGIPLDRFFVTVLGSFRMKGEALSIESMFSRHLEPWYSTQSWHGGLLWEHRKEFIPDFIANYWQNIRLRAGIMKAECETQKVSNFISFFERRLNGI